jgi:hypothetical protein
VLISLALNAIFLGIIGEYLARIYSQVKPQPLTIVERVVDRTESAAYETDRRGMQAFAGIVLPEDDAAHRDATKASDNGL